MGHLFYILQRKPTSPGAQSIRDYKGQSRQMITMAFLEEGGYFDVPIQVSHAANACNCYCACLAIPLCLYTERPITTVFLAELMLITGGISQAGTGCDYFEEGLPC